MPLKVLESVSPSNWELPIMVPFEHLTSDLNEAERQFELVQNGTGIADPAPNRWRKRKRTPVEDLDAEREQKYRALEETEARKASQEDDD